MPKVVCPDCGYEHYARKNRVFHRCAECGSVWSPAKEGEMPVVKKKASERMQEHLRAQRRGERPGQANLKPGGGRTPKPKPPPKKRGRPRKDLEEEEREEPTETPESEKKKHWWDFEL